MSRHKQARTQKLIDYYYRLSRKTTCDLKRWHFRAMALELEIELAISRG